MQEWKDVLPVVVSSLGDDAESHTCILDFLRVLPEEVTEGRKITLTVRGPTQSNTFNAKLALLTHRRCFVAMITARNELRSN